MKQTFSIVIILLFTTMVKAQDITSSHLISVNYSGINVGSGVSSGVVNGSGIGLHYQYNTANDFSYGLWLSYAKANEKYDIYGVPYENDYDVFNYIFTIRYNFLAGKFKLYAGLNLGGSQVNVKTGWEELADINSSGMIIGFPVGFNWFATKNIFVTGGYNVSMILGQSLYMSDAISGFNAGVGYYFKSKNAGKPSEE